MSILEEAKRSSQWRAGEMPWAENAQPFPRGVNKLLERQLGPVCKASTGCTMLGFGKHRFLWMLCPGPSWERSTEQKLLVMTSLLCFCGALLCFPFCLVLMHHFPEIPRCAGASPWSEKPTFQLLPLSASWTKAKCGLWISDRHLLAKVCATTSTLKHSLPTPIMKKKDRSH